MESILDVFVKVSENEGIKITQLEKKIGASKGVLSRAIANNSDIQSKWLLKLVENYPQYNPEWLLTGEGEMLKNPEAEVSSPQPQENDKYIVALEKQISLLEKNNALLEDKITHLEQKLELAELKDKEAMALKIKKQRKEIDQKDEIINLQNEELDAMKSISLPPNKPLHPSKRV